MILVPLFNMLFKAQFQYELRMHQYAPILHVHT